MAQRVPTKGQPYQGGQVADRVRLMRAHARNVYDLPTKAEQLAELDKLALEAIEMVVANLNHYRAAVQSQPVASAN